MSLPITKPQALRACAWLKGCFGDEIRAAVFAPFTVDHLCAIACQETAYFWLPFIDRLTPAEVLARCVLDGSGDAAGTTRNAFPRNTAAFAKRFGPAFTQLLVDEGNRTRALRGLRPWAKIYKGYGLFQYDLQFVLEDEAFFRLRQWHDFRRTLDRCLLELRRTWARHSDLREAIRAYNGSGPAARQYAANVLQYAEWSRTVK
jgi:hypothetical protein